jgi:LPS export ABC transporter protein LptC
MRRVKIAILISIVLVGGLVLLRLWVNLRERKASEKLSEVPKISTDGKADTRLEKIHLVEDKHGQKTWELEATSVQQYQDQNMLVLEDVKVTFFSKDGRVVVLTGKEGKVYQDSKNLEIIGDVVLTSKKDGYSLKTQSISYNHKENIARTSDPVEIEGEQLHLEGRGMLVDLDAKTFKVLNQVKTRWRGGRKG